MLIFQLYPGVIKNNMEPGKLYLVPTPLSDQELSGSIHLPVLDRVKIFIVEEIRTARRFLKKAGISAPIESLIFHELNEHTAEGETIHFLDEILNGKDIALLSEAGVPCVANPGHSFGWPFKYSVGFNGFRT